MKKLKKIQNNVTLMSNAEMKEIVGGQVRGDQCVYRCSDDCGTNYECKYISGSSYDCRCEKTSA